MTVESGVEVSRMQVGKVVVERTPGGFYLFVQAPAWAKIVEGRDIAYEDSRICYSTGTYNIHHKPDGISGTFRESYAINHGNEVNLAPLLVHGLAEGVRFDFAGVYSGEFLKKLASRYKEFLSGSFSDFSRPIRIEYNITAE